MQSSLGDLQMLLDYDIHNPTAFTVQTENKSNWSQKHKGYHIEEEQAKDAGIPLE